MRLAERGLTTPGTLHINYIILYTLRLGGGALSLQYYIHYLHRSNYIFSIDIYYMYIKKPGIGDFVAYYTNALIYYTALNPKTTCIHKIQDKHI